MNRDYLLASLLFAASFFPAAVEAAGSATRPNIIFILADDLGIDGLSCYGGDAFNTPNIDRLAASGMRFQTCLSSPLCGPSRCVLMTGRFPFRTGGLNNNSWNAGGTGPVSTNERPIATLLKQAGYATGMAGKWRQMGETPKDWGFDEYLTDPTGNGWFWQTTYILNGTTITVPAGTYQPDVIQNFTLDFIQRHKDEPFFFYYPMHLVHTPIQHTPDSPPADGAARYPDNIAYMDKQVGELMAQLDSLGLRQNTLVVFSGDNGTNPMYTTTVNGRALSGYKGSMLEGGARVPFIASWPGTTPANTVSTDIVSFADPHATFLELAGANQPTDFTFDSVSLAPQLRGETGTPRTSTFVQLDTSWYVRDPLFKLDQSGNLRDMSDAPFTEPIIPPTADTPASAAARVRLAAVLAQLNPGANILDTDGDGALDGDEVPLGRNPANASDLGFEFNDADGGVDGWSTTKNVTNINVLNGTLQGKTTTVDPNLTHKSLLFNSNEVPKIAVKLKATATGTVQLFWSYKTSTGSTGFTASQRLDADYTTANVWQTLVFTLSNNANWNGKTITDLRLDPIMAANADFQIDWIRALTGTMTAPTISTVSNQVVTANNATAPISFTVGSGWTPASSLEVIGSSSNTTLLPNENILFNGIGSNRMISLTPAANQTGTTTLELVVSDGVLSATSTFTLTVTSNTPPTLAPLSDRTLIAGQRLAFATTASDTDVPAQALTFSLLNPPTGAVVDPSSGAFTWRPTLAQAPSVNVISVKVEDNGVPSLSATQSFTVTVSQPAKPSISNVGMVNQQFTFIVNGDSGPDYTVEASTDLIDWSPIWTNPSPTPPFLFTDPDIMNFSHRFYRVWLGP
jgi:arylsulfatase A